MMTDEHKENKGAEHVYPYRTSKDSIRNSELFLGFRQQGDIINMF